MTRTESGGASRGHLQAFIDMPLFYRKAFEAACRGQIPSKLTDAHFDTWQGVEAAFLMLPTYSQWCDAVFGDWLMRLDAPGGVQLWESGRHLTQGGGLDANYLAELAQNANDAADGREAELRVKPGDGWLFVANNGRMVTPLNLIGLCNFFGHFPLQIPGVRAIGRFGVGFKSSFWIADQIYVHTWSADRRFTFRIPITSPARNRSYPDAAIRDRVIAQLTAVNVSVREQVLTLDYAGFCTPEYVDQMPPELEKAVKKLATSSTGTLFAYQLHDDGRNEVQERIAKQTERIYELCPLFVPCLRRIELASKVLELTVEREDLVDTPAGQMRVVKTKLSVSVPGQNQSHARFWRLAGNRPDDKWQLALHADSQFRLHIGRTEDEQNESIRDGSAYAFFPLHAVEWPLRLHLNLDLPTILSRGDWAHTSPAEARNVETQLASAILALTHWLSSHQGLWHPDWRVEHLFERKPTASERWPATILDNLKSAAQTIPILRSLWGGKTTANCRSVQIVAGEDVRLAWAKLGTQFPDVVRDWPLIEAGSGICLSSEELTAADVAELFGRIKAQIENQQIADGALWRAMVTAFLSCKRQTTHTLETILKSVPVERKSGLITPLQILLDRTAGAELQAEWHKTLRQIAAWLLEVPWSNIGIFEKRLPLRDRFRALAEPQVYIEWDEIGTRMADEIAWKEFGEQFWEAERTPCPAEMLQAALKAIRVPDGNKSWLPILGLWIDDDTAVDCFGSLLRAWPLSYTHPQRNTITNSLESWGVFELWRREAEERLKSGLHQQLTLQLNDTAVSTGEWKLLPHELTDWKSLAKKLHRQSRPIDRWVASQLSDDARAALQSPQTPQTGIAHVRDLLVQAINNLIHGPVIFDEARFQGIRVEPDTTALLARNPLDGGERSLLNRLLLADAYPSELLRKPGEALAIVFSQAFLEAHKSLANNPNGNWHRIVNDAKKWAVEQFIQARVEEQQLSRKRVTSAAIPANVQAALRLDPNCIPAPCWLTEAAYKTICEMGLQASLGFIFETKESCHAGRAALVRGLLDIFHKWQSATITPNALAGIDEMAEDVTRRDRRNWPVGLAPHQKPTLKELVCAQAETEDADPEKQLSRSLLSGAVWRSTHPLPEALSKIPRIAEACIQPNKLQLEVTSGTLSLIEESQIPAAALKIGFIRQLVDEGTHRLYATADDLEVNWKDRDGERVATVQQADFAADDDKLIFANSLSPTESEQYEKLLHAYEENDLASAEYALAREAGLAPYDRFLKFRSIISKTLVDSRVRRHGYAEKHILRELLQNAESAYAGKREDRLPVEPWFEVSFARIQDSTYFRVTVSHEGRAFNEIDKNGVMRPDVDLIVMESAPPHAIQDGVGRFNRGFKSIFCAARDKRVRIESGEFDFTIQDLMLRFFANPRRITHSQNPITRFTFDVSRHDAMSMLGLEEPLCDSRSPSVLNASSLVFLRYIRRVKIEFEQRIWEWRTESPRSDGWHQLVFDPCGGLTSERFWVYHAPRLESGSPFAVAIRVGDRGIPKRLDKSWQWLRLTFETDEKFELDVLVNARFEAEMGRRRLLSVRQGGLVDKALEAAIDRCQQDFTQGRVSKELWLGWARVLGLNARLQAVAGRLLDASTIVDRVKSLLTKYIPHHEGLVAAGALATPTELMRRLSKEGYCQKWGIDTATWIDLDIAGELPERQTHELGLSDCLISFRSDPVKLKDIDRDIDSRAFQSITRSFPDEVKKAKDWLKMLLEPSPRLQVENWQAAKLLHLWQTDNDREGGRLLEKYTLEGENWSLLYPGDATAKENRIEKLRREVTDVASCKNIWYRLLGLACLMSVRGRTRSLQRFWKEQLGSGFWERTSQDCDFGESTRDLFKKLVSREYKDANSSGEFANYWRCVFYDVRKVHHLVWQCNFAETVLQFMADPARADQLPHFLRSGRLDGQDSWAGVLGQSAGASIFFVVREFCRLGVITAPALDGVRRLAFFPCTPVRRAAVRIGWLEPKLAERTDFEGLAEVSTRLFEKIADDPNIDENSRKQLLELYDIPLLHLGLNL